MIVYNDLPHGFLNYDSSFAMPETAKCNEDAINLMKELLKIEH